ncbi:MAG: peptidase [Promethearchaeota archaeon]
MAQLSDVKQRALAKIDEEKESIIDLLRKMVQIPSVVGDEKAGQEFMAKKFGEMGFTVDMWTPDYDELKTHPGFASPNASFENRPNVVGVLKGAGGGRSLILNGHMDVVSPYDESLWEHGPWSADIVGNRMYGRGSSDMKGGIAAMTMAVTLIKKAGIQLKGDVIIESVIEEEAGGVGTLACVVRGYKADAALITEPTVVEEGGVPMLCPAQGGSMWFKVHVQGKSAHAGLRYEGVSAIEKALKICNALWELEKFRNEKLKHPLYQRYKIPIPLNIGILKSGVWPSSVPEEATIQCRIGVAPGESIESVRTQVKDYLQKFAELDSWLVDHPPKVEFFGGTWIPTELPLDHPLVKIITDSYIKVFNQEPELAGTPWGADGGLLVHHGDTPVVIFGPGDMRVIHFPNEFIEIDKLIAATKVIALAILDWCGFVD